MPGSFSIIIHEPGEALRMHRLTAGDHDIGRDPACGIVLTGEDVSRRHARLTVGEGCYWVQDLGSATGTHVDGALLEGVRRYSGMLTLHCGSAKLTIQSDTPDAKPPVGKSAGAIAKGRITARADAAVRGQLPVAGLASQMALRLQMLYDLPLQFASETELPRLYSLILDRVIDLIPGANRGALLIIEHSTNKLAVRASLPSQDPPISRTLVRRAAEEQQGFIWSDEAEAEVAPSMIRLSIRTGMYVPLLWKGRTIGVLCVDNQERGNAFLEEDLKFLIFVAHYAASAVANQLLQDDIEQNNRTLQNLLGNFSPKLRGKLLRKSREGRLQPGGEKSDVTILMLDLRGFTRATAAMDSEAVVEMLNDYFSVLGDIIFQHDGTIDKFIGDAILAVFGSPEPDQEHPQHAVQCAVAMRGAMTDINQRRRDQGLPLCEAGIGVHTGEVLHGFIGAAERLEFTVIGDTVNKASRYCDGAKAGQILLGPSTWAAVQGSVAARAHAIGTKHEGHFTAYLVD
ncbi:MAG: adenylate/guanylate cyclase domain-containing protein [Verrucomicrobiales bacterium]